MRCPGSWCVRGDVSLACPTGVTGEDFIMSFTCTCVQGFFSLVNTIWLFAIFGIRFAVLLLFANRTGVGLTPPRSLACSISVGPVFLQFVLPITRRFMFLGRWMFRNVVWPLLRALHNAGVFEAAIYVLCAGLIVDGLTLPRDIGHYITVTGLALLLIPASTCGLGCVDVSRNDPPSFWHQ